MDPLQIGAIGVIVVLVCFSLGVPVGVSMAIVGTIGSVAVLGSVDKGLHLLTTTPYFTAATYAFTTLPLFGLMGHLALHGGIGEELFALARNWVAKMPGGLASATIAAQAGFGACTGSSVIASLVFAKMSVPEMRKAGYSAGFACATAASGGILAMLIPPSFLFIVYGQMVEQSIGTLFIAGVLPGLLAAGIFMAGITLLSRVKPGIAPSIKVDVSWKEKVVSLRRAWSMLVLALSVIGGIYGGIFTATEAGGIGALGALTIALVRRKLKWATLRNALLDTVQTVAVFMILVIGAAIFSRFLTLSGVAPKFAQLIVGTGWSPMTVFIAFMFMYLVMGCFIDSLSMFAITLPLVFPVIVAFGYNPIWFGVVLVAMMEIGAVTPPFGVNLFAVSASAPDIPIEQIIAGIMPYFFMMLIWVAILIAFPQISLFLPNLMK